MTNWTNTPPTKAGRYYLRCSEQQSEITAILSDDGTWDAPHYVWLNGEWLVQFGPRIPTADELAELPGLVEEYAEYRESSAIARAGFDRMERRRQDGFADDTKAKINAILGVADDAGAD